MFERSAEIRARNPLFGPNRLKLGVFGLNSIGCALTLVPEAYRPSWAGSLAAAQAADEAGFEAIVPYARWKSYVKGNVHHRSSQVMECFSWATAVAARTERAAIFATCHVPAMHPIVAAKQGATIDQISGGRFGLNVVAGWYAGELGMFGVDLLDHADRYAQAAEWTEILRRAWSEEEEFDFEGRFYDVRGAYFEPRPAQAPAPPIMNAGGSERGREFAARFSDLAFVMFESSEPEAMAASIESARALARERHGRELQIWTPAYVVQADSDEAAAAYVAHYGAECGDYEAADAFIEGMIETSSNLPPEVLRALRLRIVEGGGGYPLVGTAETIAARMEELSRCGLDGLLLSWIEYEPGIRRFAREVSPLLAERGLRR
ncbi:MAG: LLM class flavin-dependent oxidoreductase [Actinobacteria bacterium]|nr:LLM class flavin-dependent oxidoreductase [Actinomycetota bacterium]